MLNLLFAYTLFMKKLYILASIFLLNFSLNAQIVNIPDANFKAKLLSANATNYVAMNALNESIIIDINSDGEIQQSEALQVKVLNIGNSNIVSAEGISNFLNLEELGCSSNQLTALDVIGLPQLKVLRCDINQLTVLTLNNPQLESLYCNQNQLTALDVSNMPHLSSIDCSDNFLSSINLQNSNAIQRLICYGNQLSQIDLSGLTTLNLLSLSHNLLTSLSIPKIIFLGISDESEISIGNNPLTNLTFASELSTVQAFDCSNTQLTSLDLTTVSLWNNISITDNPLLQHINMKNGNPEYCFGSPNPNSADCSLFYFFMSNNPQL